MKRLFYLSRKIIISCFILYGFNYIANDFNIIIPINFVNVLLVTFLGPFGICGIVFFRIFMMWGCYGFIKWCKKIIYWLY